MSRSIIWITNGLMFGASFALGEELFRIQKSGTKTCTKCLAPVNNNGIWSGEREPRSYSFSYAVDPKEWNYKERLERRRKCYGCKKPLDPTSVIVLDRSWHRKCVKCTMCEKAISGPRYYMLNNQIFDQTCFHQAKRNPKLQRSHTAIIDLRYPSPLTSEDIEATSNSNQSLPPQQQSTSISNDHQSRLQHYSPSIPKLRRNYSISSSREAPISEEHGKMSQEMKRKLANDLLSTLNALRVREWRKKTVAEEMSIVKEVPEQEEDSKMTEKTTQKTSNISSRSFSDK